MDSDVFKNTVFSFTFLLITTGVKYHLFVWTFDTCQDFRPLSFNSVLILESPKQQLVQGL